MTICLNSEPIRDDDFAKDGYSASCTKSTCLAKIGQKPYYKSKVGNKVEEKVEPKVELTKEEEIIEKYQGLKCYYCGDSRKGEMTICKNESDPNRSDGYG